MRLYDAIARVHGELPPPRGDDRRAAAARGERSVAGCTPTCWLAYDALQEVDVAPTAAVRRTVEDLLKQVDACCQSRLQHGLQPAAGCRSPSGRPEPERRSPQPESGAWSLSMPLNDAHCHFFSPRFFETLARDAGGRFDADPAVASAGGARVGGARHTGAAREPLDGGNRPAPGAARRAHRERAR